MPETAAQKTANWMVTTHGHHKALAIASGNARNPRAPRDTQRHWEDVARLIRKMSPR